jgi:hypothetical protein
MMASGFFLSPAESHFSTRSSTHATELRSVVLRPIAEMNGKMRDA